MSPLSPLPSPFSLVRLTAPGRGAVATLLLDGENAVGVLGGFLDRPLENRFGGPTYAKFPLGAVAEEVVLFPVSPDCVRIHTHGGEAVVAAISERFATAGIGVVEWEAFVRRRAAGLSLRDRIEAEARIALSRARTQRTAAILLDQLGGALWTAIEERRLGTLLRWAGLGLRLTEPYRVALVGMTNAGKSSLFNALLGFERGIVDSTPGTTRDTVVAETALDGWPILLIDTAGHHADDMVDDPLERAGIERTLRTAVNADLVVEVVDATTGLRLDGLPSGRLVVLNKTDLPDAADWSGPRLQVPDALPVSAATGFGVKELAKRIARTLVPEAPLPGQAVPFTPELVATILRLQTIAEPA